MLVKSLHEAFEDQTGIDLNRAGTPLLEVVSEPELSYSRRGCRLSEKNPLNNKIPTKYLMGIWQKDP